MISFASLYHGMMNFLLDLVVLTDKNLLLEEQLALYE